MNYRRLLQPAILVAGLVGIALAVARTLDDAQDQVFPGIGTLLAASGLSLMAIVAAGQAWAALFRGSLDGRRDRFRIAGTFYVSQLTKYLPVGGVIQATSQVSLAAATGVPLAQVALAFPVSALCTVAAGGTLGAGLALDTELPGFVRALALLGLATPALLHRRVMEGFLTFARRRVRRIPTPDQLPSQKSIVICYGWALANLGAFAAAYTILLGSLTEEASPLAVFCAYALSWVAGFLIVPVPAGIGVREAVLVAAVPGVSAALLLAASLAQRLLSIGAELAVLTGNKLAARRHRLPEPPAGRRDELKAP